MYGKYGKGFEIHFGHIDLLDFLTLSLCEKPKILHRKGYDNVRKPSVNSCV